MILFNQSLILFSQSLILFSQSLILFGQRFIAFSNFPFQALKILRADPETCHIPVVALSANAIPRDIEKGLAAGFFLYLTKPIKVNEFMAALDTALKFSDPSLPATYTGRPGGEGQ